MQFACDAPERKTWFRIETEDEAILDATAMRHALDWRFRHEQTLAAKTFRPDMKLRPFERNIGLAAHIGRTMPMFFTLRDGEGTPLATALVPRSQDDGPFSIVGPEYSDPFETEKAAIAALEHHVGRALRHGGDNAPKSARASRDAVNAAAETR